MPFSRARIAQVFRPGDVKAHGRAALPSGWLWCDGSAVSRATYAALFAAIGETFGAGDGATTFNVPDLRGRLPVGKDNMGGSAANRLTSGGAGIDGSTLGAAGGAQTVTLTEAQMPSHTHTVNGQENTTGFENAPTFLANGSASSWNTTSKGSGNAHNNMPPAQVFNWIIKT